LGRPRLPCLVAGSQTLTTRQIVSGAQAPKPQSRQKNDSTIKTKSHACSQNPILGRRMNTGLHRKPPSLIPKTTFPHSWEGHSLNAPERIWPPSHPPLA
jgi:hypothetical protein